MSQDLERRVANLERQVRELMGRLNDPSLSAPTSPPYTFNPVMNTCACPPMSICGNVACPRALRAIS